MTNEIERIKVLTIAGDINIKDVPVIEAKLSPLIDDSNILNIVIDLTAVTHVDETAMTLLISEGKRFVVKGGRIILVTSWGTRVRKLFEATVLDQFFPVFPDLDEALSSIDRSKAEVE
jgi:anti-anti-sigma factor